MTSLGIKIGTSGVLSLFADHAHWTFEVIAGNAGINPTTLIEVTSTHAIFDERLTGKRTAVPISRVVVEFKA